MQLRKLFERAIELAHDNAYKACIITVDELDALSLESTHERIEKLVSTEWIQAFDWIDSLHPIYVLVIGIAKHESQVDSFLKRVNRFEKVLHMPVPSLNARIEILQHLCKDKQQVEQPVDLNQVATDAYGFLPADLAKLVSDTTLIAANSDRVMLCSL